MILYVDFEVTNHEYGSALDSRNDVVLACWAEDDGPIQHKFGGALEQGALRAALERAEIVVAHNAKFELQWLNRFADARNVRVHDTMLGEYVIAGNRRYKLSLEDTAKRYGFDGKVGPIANLIHAGVCPSTINEPALLEYCRRDVELLRQIYPKQANYLRVLGLEAVMKTRCLITPALADIEAAGMCLDPVVVAKEYTEHETALRTLRTELNEISEGINVRSPKQVRELLYDILGFSPPTKYGGEPIRTATGQLATDAATLAKLKPRNERQREFLRLRKEVALLDSAMSKNLEFFKGVCDHQGGIFRARFNQAVTQTHRLSSSGNPLLLPGWDRPRGVQFQNLPRGFKRLFKARREGWLVAEADGSQLEFRVAAFLSQDPAAIASIKAKEDVHQFTANVLTEAGQPTTRQEAKAHTFKPLYGGTSGTEAERAYYQAFREKYKKLAETQEGWVQEVLETKQLVMPWGMRFYWPDTHMEPSGYITNKASIYNYPVQSFATADIIPIAVAELHRRMVKEKMAGFIVNTVHDSVIAEIPREEWELFSNLVVQVFCKYVYDYLYDVYNVDFNVPLGVEVKAGSHWGEAEFSRTEENVKDD